MNAAPSRILALLRGIDAAIAPLNPALVYLHRPDLRGAFQTLEHERGASWIGEVVSVLGRSPYGRRHKVRDARGLIAYYRRQAAIVDAVLPKLTLRRLAIDVSGGRWPQYEKRMAAFLGMKATPAPELPLAAQLRHVGQYRGAITGRTAVVSTDGRALYLQLPATLADPLVRVSPGRFCLRSLPVDVGFDYDASGAARRFTYHSRLIGEAERDRSWVRV